MRLEHNQTCYRQDESNSLVLMVFVNLRKETLCNQFLAPIGDCKNVYRLYKQALL